MEERPVDLRQSAGEPPERTLGDGGVRAEGQGQVGVQLSADRKAVREAFARPAAGFEQRAHGPVAEQPHADVQQNAVGRRPPIQLGLRGLLKEPIKAARSAARRKEHPVTGGDVGSARECQANHVGLGDRSAEARAMQQHVSARHAQTKTVRRPLEHVGQKRLSEVAEPLVRSLSPSVPDHGERHHRLAEAGVRRESSAQTSAVQDEHPPGTEPFLEGLAGRGREP